MSVNQELMSFIRLGENFNFDNLQKKPGCHVLLKAFSVAISTVALDVLLLKLKELFAANQPKIS